MEPPSSRLLPALLVSALIGLLIFAGLWLSEKRGNTDLQVQVAKLNTRLAMMESQIAHHTGSPVGVAAQAQVVPPPSAPQRSEPAQGGFFSTRYTPQVVNAMRAQEGFRVDRDYGDIIRRLGLPADKSERLRELLVERKQLPLEVMKVLSDNNTVSKSAYDTFLEKEQGDLDSQIAALLGNSYPSFQDYNATMQRRQSLELLINRLSYTPTPLQDEQITALVHALPDSAETRKFGQGVVWDDNFMQAAQALLTPDQYKVFQTVRNDRIITFSGPPISPTPKAPPQTK